MSTSRNETSAVLVAVAAANRLSNTNYPRKAEEPHEVTLIPPQHREKAPRIEERTAHILDALATILVSASQGEVVAVGVQADYGSFGGATVTLAANTDVPQTAEAHLKEVWGVLAALSVTYRKEDKSNKTPKQTFADETPVKSRDEPLPAQYLLFAKLVYQYCFNKFLRRLEKRYNKTAGVREKLMRKIGSGELKIDNTVEKLLYILIKLHSLRGCDRSVTQQDEFVKDVTFAFFNLQDLQSESETNKLRDILDTSFEDTLRFMEKALGLQKAIMNLDRLAASRRMSPILRKSLTVNRLPTNECERLPSPISAWRAAAEEAVKQLEVTDKFDSCLVKAHKKYQGQRGVVHSEMKILDHFLTRPAGSVPPLSYIGVSKLSCLGCWTTINAWNSAHDAPKYRVRGTHGKWYFPWAVPTSIANDKLKAIPIHDSLQEEVINCLRKYDLCRLRSDSSVNSSGSAWSSYSLADKDRETFMNRFFSDSLPRYKA